MKKYDEDMIVPLPKLTFHEQKWLRQKVKKLLYERKQNVEQSSMPKDSEDRFKLALYELESNIHPMEKRLLMDIGIWIQMGQGNKYPVFDSSATADEDWNSKVNDLLKKHKKEIDNLYIDKYKNVVDTEENMKKIQAKKNITVKEFSEIYNISKSSQQDYRSRMNDSLPFHQKVSGGKIVYVVEEVEQWFANQHK